MPKPYPMELRERVVTAWMEGGSTQREVADRFVVGLPTVGRWVARQRETGSVKPSAMGGAHRPYVVDEAGGALILEMLECVPDRTLPEICEAYAGATGVKVSPQTMSDTVRRIGLTRKRGLFGG